MSGEKDQRERRVTIVDVAKHAGVSTASASKVLRNAYGASEPMRARVQQAMQELGYRPYGPARGMRGRTFTIGVVVSDFENPFFSLITTGLSSVIRPQSYELFVSPGGFDESSQKTVVEAMIDHHVDGLVLVSPVMGIDGLEEIAGRVPLVVVGHHSRSAVFDTVSADDELGSRLIVDHLVALGHRRIAFVMHTDGRKDASRPECHRLHGFEHAMAGHGLSSDAIVLDSHWSLDGGGDITRQIADLPSPPTAVHAGADIVALGMMNELWLGGRSVPEAYSLVGYDNSRTSSFGPVWLTTVDQSGQEMGRLSGHRLIERISGRAEARHDVLEPHLVVRGTTAPPSGGPRSRRSHLLRGVEAGE